ncbi:Nudix hydrolase 1 [Cladobotryum mycophilum]|uniref:Nudix hydrolase 1 n=1 Tax=Cladobotryum mycophilum TaxID=491253 RepID=A0ABR0SL18_9HYPO
MSELNPRVGIAAIITDANGRVLVGKRKGSHGAGTWQFPGGHLEYKEDVTFCAERETLEETALKVKGNGIIAVTNDIFETEGKHYITLFVHCKMLNPEDEPQVLEPNKCEGWHWKTWQDLKDINKAAVSGTSNDKLFLPIINLFEQTSSPEDLLSRKSL